MMNCITPDHNFVSWVVVQHHFITKASWCMHAVHKDLPRLDVSIGLLHLGGCNMNSKAFLIELL